MEGSTHPRTRGSPPPRPKYRAARAFYLTLLIGACFTLYLAFSLPHSDSRGLQSLAKRSEIRPLDQDDQCRLVHKSDDQCAFVKRECPTEEEGGFAAYLDLYFCKLNHAKPVAFIILISWLGLLFSTIGIAASDFFCINLSTIATILGMSESMAGVTFLAFGNGSPDVFSTFAAMSTNSGSLAVGELFGAAGFITAVVAGSMALIRPFHVSRKSFIRDVGFFVVAAAFSLVFLWDGKLRFWECIAMVIFYIFYVAFVVVWHWWIARRRKKREREAAMRGHFVHPEEEADVEEEEYHDDPDERASLTAGIAREDWSALERGQEQVKNGTNEEDEEVERDRWMSELNSNMRLTRSTRDRSQTLVPVRPSLVGALEFQAVLKSLQKSRNIQTIPLHARRYSDDPTWTTAQQQDHMTGPADPASRRPFEVAVHGETTATRERSNLNLPTSAPTRMRASSVSNPETLHMDSALQQHLQRTHADDQMLVDIAEEDGTNSLAASKATPTDTVNSLAASKSTPADTAQSQAAIQGSPSIRISPSPSSQNLHEGIPRRTKSPDHLEPPASADTNNTRQSPNLAPLNQRPKRSSSQDLPSEVPRSTNLPKIRIPSREASYSSKTSTTSFPRYLDDPSPAGSRAPSIYLPSPSLEIEGIALPIDANEQESSRHPPKIAKFWPYSVLPPPGLIVSTLFPTIYHWREKNLWEKALGIVAAPSVFLLTITLPVVECSKSEKSETVVKTYSFDSAVSSNDRTGLEARIAANMSAAEHHSPGQHRHGRISTQGTAGHGTKATVATHVEQDHRHNPGQSGSAQPAGAYRQDLTKSPQVLVPDRPDAPQPPTAELWNRWLLIVQLFLAPQFIVLAIYSQSPASLPATWLIKPVLICLLISVVLLIPLLLTTTPTHKPLLYRYILSMAGFAVSIAWISAIASQVVGALKALAIILNMSHAIMGLTIFAVGNSLGDLVADVTVARLGYPVMALSACFGGPMLNILLGVGLSGSYILLTGAENRVHKHPDKDFKFKTYHIEVSNTLLISGFTLLLTLVGLLIFVPMNRWVFSKRIGWALILVWVLSTIGNVVLEVTGWADKPLDS